MRVEIRRPISLFAPAKLNLGLEVLGRRPDGLHEVVTILQTVSIFDRIDLLPAPRLRHDPVPGIDPGEDLVGRALRVAQETLGVALVAEVRLRKTIPIAAGLGGGSSDAGTLLGALAALADLPPAAAEAAAAELGSDVPFFVRGGTALTSGTGSTVSPLPDLPRTWFVVVTPAVEIPAKTRTLYGLLREQDLGSGQDTQTLARTIGAGQPLDPALLHNSFTRPLLEWPAVRVAADALRAAGAPVVVPSGAGPSLFVPHTEFSRARALADSMRQRGLSSRLCTTVRAGLNRARLDELRRAAPTAPGPDGRAEG